MDPVLRTAPLGFPWETPDPFLFCAHHDDHYPEGNAELGPARPLAGRDIGRDFEGKDGWRMYHGSRVPGFPEHPHRGFETVTIVLRGFIDHSDSLGATARYGNGDVQWLTAGKGINHSEMFPLLDRTAPNPLELFQIWLNLPKASKGAKPHFSMFWANDVPRFEATDDAGRRVQVRLIAGSLGDLRAPPPPPHSWASRPENEVAIWTLRLEPGARWTLPAAAAGLNRSLYFFSGPRLRVGGHDPSAASRIDLRSELPVPLENGPEASELLLLQGRPIAEPVVQHGPFVMSSRQEILQTIQEYQRTRFGGWKWPSEEPVHPAGEGRFARRPDGAVERP